MKLKMKRKNEKKKIKKWKTFDSVSANYENWELTLNAFRSAIFPIKVTQGKEHPNMLVLHPLDLARVDR